MTDHQPPGWPPPAPRADWAPRQQWAPPPPQWAPPQQPWGQQPSGQQPWGPPPVRRGLSWRHWAILGGAVAIGAAVVVLPGGDDDGYPDEWDERVVELVAFVEDERGHRFEHPVPIDFLTQEEYAAAARTDAATLTEEDEAQLEHAEGMFRALGLVEGDLDLFESGNDLADTGTLAFYDPLAERVTVRGTEVTPALAVTLVHELTHVLQDQAFGIGPDDLGFQATSGESTAFRALVEGDATRIEDRYIEQELTDAERDEVFAANDEGLEDFEAQEIPEAMAAIFALPYILGEAFVATLEATGDDAVDDAFADPPTTEEHLLDPTSFLDGQGVERVTVEAPDDAEVLDEGDFGSASLLLVLGSRIDPRQALDAAIGWAGDAYVSYEVGGRVCIDLQVVVDEESDLAELEDALTAWAAAGPAGAAVVTPVPEGVELHACDPGGAGVVAPRSAFDSLAVASIRAAIMADSSSADRSFSACYADAVLDRFSVEELTSEAEPPDFDARMTQAFEACA